MPEGPSLVIAREELQRFAGKKIVRASGSASIEMERLVGKKIKKVASWGKHLLLLFNDFTIRVHFLMFGKYMINASREIKPRLSLEFVNREKLNFYTSAVRIIEEPLDEVYDWSADIMAEKWDTRGVRKKLKDIPGVLISDALMNQDIFPGLGNIIKNEVLYRTQIHPKSVTGKIPPKKMNDLIKEVRKYAFEFLEQRRKGVLRKNWQVYTKKICRRDNSGIYKEYVGITKRRTFFCESCQKMYT
jgi:endonuclease-8